MGWLGQDISDGTQRLIRNPGFSFLVIGTLSLGLVTSSAVFAYVNAFDRAFPGAETENVYTLFRGYGERSFGLLSYPDFQDLSEAGGGRFDLAATFWPTFSPIIRHPEFSENVFGQGVTGSYFPLLGVRMSVGRGLSPEDDRPEASPSLVISDQYWRRRYGGDPGVLGKTIVLDDEAYTIVGVAGPDFLGSDSSFRPAIWIPFSHYRRRWWNPDTHLDREERVVTPILRLGDLGELGQIREFLESLAFHLDEETPLAAGPRRFRLDPVTWVYPSIRQAELPTARIMLMAAAGLLLLACANVANLSLSIGAGRRREMALRSALGASRWRLGRQLLAENMILALMAGGIALVLAEPMANRISAFFARPSVWGHHVPRELDIDMRVLAFGFVLAVVAGVLSGILPALRETGRAPGPALKAGGSLTSEGKLSSAWGRWGMSDFLVSFQVGLSVVLLFLAGLVLRTLDSTLNVDPGFDTDHTLATFFATSSLDVSPSERCSFLTELEDHLQNLPWVQKVGVAMHAPLDPHPSAPIRLQAGGEPISVTSAVVLPGYFEALGMNFLHGHSFLPTDTVGAIGAVVVNEALAHLIDAGDTPVGRILWAPDFQNLDFQNVDRATRVIGVVGNVHQTLLLDEPEPVAYYSLAQQGCASYVAFYLSVTDDPEVAVQRVASEIKKNFPMVSVLNSLTYSEVVRGQLYAQRMNAELFSVIALLGLLLVASGVFAVVSAAVAHRTREIGIRMAIGARSWHILRFAGFRMGSAIFFGLVMGVVGALMATRLVESLLWGVRPGDPVSLGVGLAVLIGVAVLAVSVPLTRALTIDPATTLQAD